MKLGSLFDGSGTAPLAAAMCGIEPVWASEIEPYPIKVTKARFPNMKHLGSILDINGAEVEPVDIICGGSPCQDLSVAGKQKGLHDGERSHLFFEMTRIIKEMRSATNGKYPRYIIWENVPGAFSSNAGYDFHAVLQAFAEIADPDVHVPKPPCRGKTDRLAWQYAGSVLGDGYSIGWRTVDAQYWGVPQRRRRIYLVADFAGGRVEEILFERKSVAGHTQPCGAQREEAPEDAGRGTEGNNRIINLNRHDVQSKAVVHPDGIAPTLWAGEKRYGGGTQYVIDAVKAAGFVGRQGAKSGSVGFENDISPALRSGITTEVVYSLQGNGIDKTHEVRCYDIGEARRRTPSEYVEVAPTITARCGTGGNNVPAVCGVYCLQGNGIDRADTAGCNGKGCTEDVSYTLNTIDRHAVAFAATVYGSAGFAGYTEGVGTPRASGGDYGPGSENLCVYPNVTGPLMANSHPGSYTGQDAFSDMLPVVPSDTQPRKYIVRRLTPLECCRLQGFPDWWESGVEGSDSARYKMWGNGMSLPNMLHVMRGIAKVEGVEK